MSRAGHADGLPVRGHGHHRQGREDLHPGPLGAQDLLQQRVAGQGAEHEAFKDFSAFDFLKWLRDATCHGDARQISPSNMGGSLVGFEIRATARGDQERSLVLSERDLRRIGNALATVYCDALQTAASNSPDHFASDARSMREERKAA